MTNALAHAGVFQRLQACMTYQADKTRRKPYRTSYQWEGLVKLLHQLQERYTRNIAIVGTATFLSFYHLKLTVRERRRSNDRPVSPHQTMTVGPMTFPLWRQWLVTHLSEK